MIWNEIVCLGDSLTYGARDEYGRSYPAELGKILSTMTGEFYICHNYGINGETSSDLLRRSWNILKSNKSSKIAILMIGTNDTKKPTPIPIYQDNIRQIVMSIRANGMTPIVTTLPALNFSPYYQKNRDMIDEYSECLREMGRKYNFKVCQMPKFEEYLVDGVHFGNAGYTKIAQVLAKEILELR
jgi:lysophospholipase L1-like esterase